MKVKITAGARQFGYLIWSKKTGKELEKALDGRTAINVLLNGFDLGMKNIDYKYHRISLGYRFTRAIPETHNTFSIKFEGDRMEVKTLDGK